MAQRKLFNWSLPLQLPYYNHLVYCIVNIKQFMDFFFVPAWGIGFWMWGLTPSRGVRSLISTEYYVVMCGPWPGTLVTWPWLRLSMIYYWALRLWSQICVTCCSCWFPDLAALSCCAVARCLRTEGWLHMYEMAKEHFSSPNLNVVVVKCWFLGFVVWSRTCMCLIFTTTLT